LVCLKFQYERKKMSDKQLKSMKKELDDVLLEARVMAFIQVVRRHGDADLNDVFRLAKMCGLEHLSVNEIIGDELPRSGKDWAKRKLGDGSKPKRAIASSGFEVRTKAGRNKFDTAMLKELKSIGHSWTDAAELQIRLGGNPDQTRRSLNRLIELGKVTYKGKARGTRYKVA